jgi:hypothetical protein
MPVEILFLEAPDRCAGAPLLGDAAQAPDGRAAGGDRQSERALMTGSARATTATIDTGDDARA